ncbi:hypothetical protein A6R68_22979, partial [Neotoma lepida]
MNFLKKGVMVAKKDVHMPKHPKLADKNITPANLHHSHPETSSLRPKGPEGKRPARFTRGEADRDPYKSAVPHGADQKAEAGAGSATEFQFR